MKYSQVKRLDSWAWLCGAGWQERGGVGRRVGWMNGTCKRLVPAAAGLWRDQLSSSTCEKAKGGREREGGWGRIETPPLCTCG
jgi:hypothetical protein